MSFHVEFTAKNRADALALAVRPDLPNPVFAFIEQALKGVDEDQPVYVKASGHLYSGRDHKMSNATFEVLPIEFDAPPESD